MQLALLQQKLQQLFGQIRGVVAKNTKKKKNNWCLSGQYLETNY